MSQDLDVLLDKCIDRINKGESIEECVADYPEHAAELRPLLECMGSVTQACSSMPRAAAKSSNRARLNAARANVNEALQGSQGKRKTLFGWPLAWAAVSAMLLLALLGLGLGWLMSREKPTTPNFRILVSDEVSAIGDFKTVDVTIDSMEVLRTDASGNEVWEVVKFNPNVAVDLTRLQGLNAEAIWSGVLPKGQYTEVRLHIKGAVGTLRDGATVQIRRYSDDLEIPKPFVVAGGKAAVNFVFDVTVVATGTDNGTMGYALESRENESGADQEFNEIGDGDLSVQVVEGNIVAGQAITVLVSLENTPVSGAVVRVNGENVGVTNAYGRLSLLVPAAAEVHIDAVSGGLEGSIDIEPGERSDLETETHVIDAKVSDNT